MGYFCDIGNWIAGLVGYKVCQPELEAVSLNLKGMVLIPAATFEGGEFSSWRDKEHEITISHPIYIDQYLVTNGDYEHIMGGNPSSGDEVSRQSVKNVSWYNADKYCKAIGKQLPTEAQWELAVLHGYISDGRWEWVNDWYGLYSEEHVVDPTGPEDGETKVLRGGHTYISDVVYNCDTPCVDDSRRMHRNPDFTYNTSFRCAASIEE